MGGSAGISAAAGIQGWMRVFDRSASAVSGAAAQVGSDAANQTGSNSDMVDGMIGMHLAAAGVKANVAVFRTADEMLGSLLDMKA